jgi:hypothetical protein
MLLLGLWLAGVWRIYLMGVYVGEAGVQLRGFLRSTVIPWPEIAAARVAHDTRYGNEALFLVAPDGRHTPTPLYRSKHALFSRNQPASSAVGVSADTLQQAANRINELAAAHHGRAPVVWPTQ